MKKQEVPQDNEGMLEDKFRELCYAVDADGNYVTVHSTGWSPKNAAMKQAWEEIHIKTEEARQLVLAGKKSMLAYYMERSIMDVKLLSQYTGIPKRKIKRHLKPSAFQTLDKETLELYAEALKISVEELTDISRLEKKDE
ncbi:MAG: hypothetical protein IMY74_04575 [Bacteroidetes bacterium]|nr:hypothetical protein [Bacteroidota bacterium]